MVTEKLSQAIEKPEYIGIDDAIFDITFRANNLFTIPLYVTEDVVFDYIFGPGDNWADTAFRVDELVICLYCASIKCREPGYNLDFEARVNEKTQLKQKFKAKIRYRKDSFMPGIIITCSEKKERGELV